jgi:hypothetical protein
MQFDQDEICTILRKHVVEKWGVPEGSIEGVSWKAVPSGQRDRPDTLTIVIGVKTEGGDPYRTPPK